MTQGLMRPYNNLIQSSDQVYVDATLGSDTLGSGSMDNPLATIAAGISAAAAGDTVNVGPGTYAETLVINSQVNLRATVRGAATISGNVAAGGVVEISGAANNVTIDGVNITNTNAGGIVAMGLLVDNTGDTILGTITYKNGTIRSGNGASAAFCYIGDAGLAGGIPLNIFDASLVGGMIATCEHVADVVWFKNIVATGGLAAYAFFDGTAGSVIFDNFLMPVSAAAEVISHGAGAATGTNLFFGSSVFACSLSLDNAAGTGIVTVTGGSQIARIVATEVDQMINTWLGEDDIAIELRNINVNDGVARDYALVIPPAGRVLAPYIVRTATALGITGAAFSCSVSGVGGAGSIVAATGPAAVAAGVLNETVLQDTATNAAPLLWSLVALSGAVGDEFADAYVECKYF